MKKVLVIDSAISGEKIDECYKELSTSIYLFLRDESDIEIEIKKIDGGRELISIIENYDIVIMLYETCLFDAIVDSEKYPDIKYILLSDYVNRKELALEKGFCVADSLTEVVRFVREEDG